MISMAVYVFTMLEACPDSKVHGANMGPIWGRQDPAGPHVGPMNFAIWHLFSCLEQCWLIGNGTHRNKIQYNLNKNTKKFTYSAFLEYSALSISRMHLEMSLYLTRSLAGPFQERYLIHEIIGSQRIIKEYVWFALAMYIEILAYFLM